MHMRFSIRDDDISYFTTNALLEKVYDGIDVPISFAVIPFVHRSACFVNSGQKDMYPVGDNKTLVRFLRDKIENGTASIILHGYSHRQDTGKHEFESDIDLSEKVNEGKRYLEDVFDTKVKSFVAPNHAFSRNGMKAVIDNGLDIIGSPSLLKRPVMMNIRYIWNMKKLLAFRITHEPGIRYPYPINFGTHKELYCYGIVPSTKKAEVESGLRFCHGKNGVFCVAIHSHDMDSRMTSVLKDIVEEAKNLGADFMSVDDAIRTS